MERNAEKYTCSKMANRMRRRNGELTESQLLASGPTKLSPTRHSHHGVTLDVQSQNGSARRNYASEGQVCLSGILTSQGRQLLGVLLTSGLLDHHQTPHSPHSTTSLARYTLRRIRSLQPVDSI